MADIRFPADFTWGTATAAYQVEGAAFEDGKGESIWDRFSHEKGRIERDETGDASADQYHRYPEDIKIMKQLGMKAYRFSVSWPRIYPHGRGKINERGLDHYDRLVDTLLEAGIDPWVTLYHWDLPQALEDAGGWAERRIVGDFSDYAYTMAKRLGDRVSHWMTFNEAMVFTYFGYRDGKIAPGRKDPLDAWHAAYHVNLAHGEAFSEIKSLFPNAKVGITHAVQNYRNLSGDEASKKLIEELWQENNGIFLEPIICGTFPQKFLKKHAGVFPHLDEVDLHSMNQYDFVGLQYYFDHFVKNGALVEDRLPEYEYTEMGWPITPDGLYNSIMECVRRYRPDELVITENGMALADEKVVDGHVHDKRRQKYFKDHLRSVYRAVEEGAPVTGYLAWSLIDNFEWACGYRPRFGLVHLNLKTKKRTIKDSGYMLADIIRNNGF